MDRIRGKRIQHGLTAGYGIQHSGGVFLEESVFSAEVTGARWSPRSSKPLCCRKAAGGFDSHSPPPFFGPIRENLDVR